jgi:hypothetical protein
MRLVTFISLIITLLITPSLALAAPVIAAIIVFVETYYALILVIGMAIYGSMQQRKAEKDAYQQWINGLHDRTITAVSGESPYVYIYGETIVGSSIVAIINGDTAGTSKYLVCVLAAHECESIEEVYIAGHPFGWANRDPLTGACPPESYFYPRNLGMSIESPSTNGSMTLSKQSYVGTVWAVGLQGGETDSPIGITVTGTLVPGSTDLYEAGALVTGSISPGDFIYYTSPGDIPTVHIWPHMGTAGDPVDPVLHALNPTLWPSTATLDGFCYLVVQLHLSQSEFQAGIPSIQAVVKGKKILDVRTGTTAWSDNNALVAYDYLTSEMCGVDPSDIPLADYIAAANICDETNADDSSIPVDLGKRYTFNGTITADMAQEGTLEHIAQSMAGSIVSTTWSIAAGKYIAPVMPLDQSDIVGKVGITPSISDTQLYNGVKGQYIGPENDYALTDFTPYQNSTYVTADGLEKWTNIDFPFTDSVQRIHNLSRIFTEDQRNSYTVNAEFSLKTWPLKVSDRVTFTSSFFGFNDKIFRVTDKKFSPSGLVELTIKEDDPTIWDFADAVSAAPLTINDVENPYSIPAISSLTLSSGTDVLLLMPDGTVVSRILATWPQSTSLNVVAGGDIELQWIQLGTTTWHSTTVTGDSTAAYLSPVQDGQQYIVRIRAVNTPVNAKSAWFNSPAYTVIGKTQPPKDVTGFTYSLENFGITLTWNANTDVDLKEYEIRVGGTDWNSATLVAKTNSTHYFTKPTTSGNIPYRIKAIDTSGNYSTNEADTTVIVAVPSATSPTASISGQNVVINWSQVTGAFAIDHYEIRYGSSWAAGTPITSLYTTSYTEKVNFSGSKTYWIAAVDVAGNVGAVTGSVTVVVSIPHAVTITSQTIDNNVLLYWTDATATLPILSYEVRKGSTYASSTLIGTKQGLFTTVFETVAGLFTYWITGIDSAGNYGTPVGIAVNVNQPPDYVFRSSIDSTFTGTISNAFVETGGVIMPVNTTETWAQHFSTRSWTDVQDQINAGYPIYIEPADSPGYYEEVFDLGVTLGSNKITMSYLGSVIAGSPTITTTLSTSADNITYTSYSGVTEIYATGFRYIKIRIAVSGGATDLYKLTSLNVRVDSKLVNDAGVLNVVSTDSGGTTATFNIAFLDVTSINVTPMGTSAAYCVVNFTSIPNPTSFKVLLFDNTGTRLSGTVSWTARGH